MSEPKLINNCLKLLTVSFLFLMIACSVSSQRSRTNSSSSAESVIDNTPSPYASAERLGYQNDNSVVKATQEKKKCLADFANFTYKWFPKDYASMAKKGEVTLVNGKAEPKQTADAQLLYEESLENVTCIDLTGDGNNEAIVTVKVSFSNRANPARIFIYGQTNGALKLLWHYDTGTAERDLRNLEVAGKTLILEEYDNKYENPPHCCPKRFFKSYFSWENDGFKLTKSETLPYEKNFREFLGYNIEAD